MKATILPAWLVGLLTATLVVSGVAVTTLVYLTAGAFLERPLAPVAAAAEQVANISLPPLLQDGLVLPPTLAPGEPAPTPIPTSEPIYDGGRTNILVMGIDRRPGQPFISRTDTMILVSIDPDEKTAAMLSIPRDLYVVIPGRGRDRINTAFVYGSQGNNPAGGAALAMQTVEYNLGVAVDHYVIVDFTAVIRAVDAVGGITVDVPVAINDPTYPDMNYGYDPLFIPAGRQHMDGTTALKYARTRHQDSDFGRAARQQQVLLALRNQVLSLGVLEMTARAPGLYRDLSEGVRTDLSLEQIIGLGRAASQIESGDIRGAVLNYGYVENYTTEQGASVLIMLNDRVSPLIRELFYGQ